MVVTQYYAADGANLLTDADVNTAGHQVDLDLDDNVIKAQVTAEDATTTKTYTLTITRARPTVTITPPALPSGEGQDVTFTVTRDPAAPEDLIVKLEISEDEDLVEDAADEGMKTVTILANATSTTYDVETIPNDDQWDKNSVVTATLVADAAYTLGDPKSATQEVQDDDFPESTAIMSVSSNTVDEGESVTVTVTVTTNAYQVPQSHGGTITIGTSDGTATQPDDYKEPKDGDHQLKPADFSAVTEGGNTRYQAVYTSTVATVNDADKEDDETFLVTRMKSLTATKITLDPPQSLTVTIRASDRSTDATLSGLTLSGVTLSPAFTSAGVTYTGSVGYGVATTTVTATKNDANAADPVIKLGETVITGGEVTLAVGVNVITVTVTAEDGSTKTYTVTVTRAAASTDAALSNLELSGVTLSPAFTSGNVPYTGSAAYDVISTTVTPTANHAGATVVIAPADADGVTDGHQVKLPPGETQITVVVTTEDGIATETYTVTVERAKATVTISAVEAEAGEGHNPVFTVTHDPVAAEPLDVKVDISETGGFVISAQEGTKTVTIPTGQVSATYTVGTVAGDTAWDEHSTVTATVQADDAYDVGDPGSAQTRLLDDDLPVIYAKITVSPNPVVEGGTVTVTVTFDTNTDREPHGAATRTVTLNTVSGGTATTSDDYEPLTDRSVTVSAANFSLAGSRYEATGTATISIVDDSANESDETFNVAMTKPPGEQVQLRMPTELTVTISANDQPQSSDATLSGLTLSGVSLNEPFDSATTSYTADVGRTEPASTTVTATPTDAGATAVIKLGDAVVAGDPVTLAVGENVITVEVTAADDSTKTYTVTVTRHADAEDDVAPLPIISTVECPDTPNPSVCDLDSELGKSKDSPVDGAFNIVVHFAEGVRPDWPVHGFVSSHITATNATVSDYESDTSNCWCYRFRVTPTGTSGDVVKVTLSIAANVLVDRGGNANVASNTLIVWATVPP